MVDVWVAPLDISIPRAVLSPAEQRRADAFAFPDDARRYTAAHAWLRHVLAAELGTSPAAVEFDPEPGKPRLAGGAGPSFNLSHAGEVALIAVAAVEVGVDIEPLGPAQPLEAMCTPAEREALAAIAMEDRSEAFLRLWTAKEAYLKAIGAGLTVEPDTIEVGLSGDDRPLPGGWWVRTIRPAPGYIGAVAAPGADWDIRLQRYGSTP
ncbi:MAG: 4'-phosphopantetheinyl transferase family protein [Acidimicrobiales bacterium]